MGCVVLRDAGYTALLAGKQVIGHREVTIRERVEVLE
jgi:hypothetical protein